MNKFLLGTVGLAALMMASGANAALKMTLETGSGASTGELLDGDADGLIEFSGSLGGFVVSTNIGISKPLVTGPTLMDLFSVEVSGSEADSLVVKLTDTDFSGSIGSVHLGVGGSTDHLLSISAYADMTNAEFGTGTLIGEYDFTAGAFSATSDDTLITSDPFSLTMIATITHSAGGQVTSFDAEIDIPEPSVLALFGAGLLGLGLARRRMKK